MFYQLSHPATVDYFVVEQGKDFSFPAHIHPCFELIIIEEGEMTVELDGINYTLRQHQAMLIFPNQIHSLSSQHSRHLLCIFSPRLVSAYSTKVSRQKPSDPLFPLAEELILRLHLLQKDASLFAKKGFLYSVCDHFDKNRTYLPQRSDSNKLLQKIFAFIENNFSGECNLMALAKELGYDYAYLSRHFRATVGISFPRYVNMYRIDHACYLLENTEQSILECALESGYTSVRSFNRNFKEYLGMTPLQYIKQK